VKASVAFALAVLTTASAFAQQPASQPPAASPSAQVPPGQTCLSQHIEAPGVSAAALISKGYDIKAAIPGGLWIQKDREVYFCNSGRALDNDVICWRLREPVKGQPCQ
jgi:hypothetical protein